VKEKEKILEQFAAFCTIEFQPARADLLIIDATIDCGHTAAGTCCVQFVSLACLACLLLFRNAFFGLG
jgi:hypothetical protein